MWGTIEEYLAGDKKMETKQVAGGVIVSVTLCITAFASSPSTIVLDFETEDDFTTPLVNGQSISTPPEFGNLVSITTAGLNSLGPAIFDSSFAGPNLSGPDADLIVGLGNILILQDSENPTQTVPDIFDVPNDEDAGGSLIFSFTNPVRLLSLVLIDINGENQDVFMTLTDIAGATRNYAVPSHWTFDIAREGPLGYDTLDLTTLAPQVGEGGSSATASESASFNPNAVIRLNVEFSGSAGLDNLTFIPEPAMILLFGSGFALIWRNNRAHKKVKHL